MEALDLSLIVPALNEAESLPVLLPRLQAALAGLRHEVLIMDDSPNAETAQAALAFRERYPEVQVIRRERNPGLSASVLDGFTRARGRCLAVIDADLQHDETLLPELVKGLRRHDVVVGSRYAYDGATSGWSFVRRLESSLAARLTRFLLGLRTRDPLSGFFAMRRSVFEQVSSLLRPRGWKILLEILALGDDLRVAEVSYTFRSRKLGTSKMNASVAKAWLQELLRLRRMRLALQRGRALRAPAPFGLSRVST